jgi:Bacterial Ig domain/Cellulase (glycosyl hydrolase family 5)
MRVTIRGVFCCALLAAAWLNAASAAELGANKFDLFQQYVGASPAVAGRDAAGEHYIKQAMADKAVADAHDAGLTFLRVSVTGFAPSEPGNRNNDLALWQHDPPAFWAAVDRMFDALDRAGLRMVPSFIWNPPQFPALTNETVTTPIRDPNSASRRLLARFIGDFIGRYKSRKTILFYELTNEMNLFADVDLRQKCRAGAPCAWDNFTTAEMIEFSRDMVRLIKSLDPSRPVTSGYSLPRPAAMHLTRRPQFGPSGPDWTPDTKQELARYLIETHQPFDIVSVHIYPKPQDNRFGLPQGDQYRLVADADAAAKSAGKPLFIGEFGDTGGATPFMAHLLDEIVQHRVDYAAIWVWEFYQTSTYQTRNTEPTRYDVEPGYSDELIALLMQAERRLGHPPPPKAPQALPRVVLTWPLPCAAVDRPVEVEAVASDGAAAVKEVEFLVDGKPLGTAAKPPYKAHFDPAGQPPGSADLAARAVGRSGIAAEFHSTVRLHDAAGHCAVPTEPTAAAAPPPRLPPEAPAAPLPPGAPPPALPPAPPRP